MAHIEGNAAITETRQHFVRRIRDFERRLQANMKDVFCSTHLSLGHECVAADLWECIKPDDWLFSYHRNHGHYLAKGGSEQKLWDEIMGLPSGLNGGYSGSQGITDESINFHSSAIVGGLVGVAAGTAYALKMDSSQAIVVCIIGDAGTEAGVFWEALNWCALHRLPIVYVVENNGMSIDARIEERQMMPIYSRVAVFGIYNAPSLREAIRYARAECPSFYEAKVKLECAHINQANMIDLSSQVQAA